MPFASLRTSSAHSRGRLASSAEIPYCGWLLSEEVDFTLQQICNLLFFLLSDFQLQQICNLLSLCSLRCVESAADGARPPAVRTTAQPYTVGRPTPLRLDSVFQRFCAVLARGEPPAMLPAARVRRQWFMTEEEGVRLRSSLFWENGPAGVCKAVFAEPIALKSVKLQGRVGIAFLQGIHNQTFL